MQELEQDVDERDGNARRMQEDIEMLENSCNEQATTIETQRLEMNQLERKLEAVSFDANLVPELREVISHQSFLAVSTLVIVRCSLLSHMCVYLYGFYGDSPSQSVCFLVYLRFPYTPCVSAVWCFLVAFCEVSVAWPP